MEEKSFEGNANVVGIEAQAEGEKKCNSLVENRMKEMRKDNRSCDVL